MKSLNEFKNENQRISVNSCSYFTTVEDLFLLLAAMLLVHVEDYLPRLHVLRVCVVRVLYTSSSTGEFRKGVGWVGSVGQTSKPFPSSLPSIQTGSLWKEHQTARILQRGNLNPWRHAGVYAPANYTYTISLAWTSVLSCNDKSSGRSLHSKAKRGSFSFFRQIFSHLNQDSRKYLRD